MVKCGGRRHAATVVLRRDARSHFWQVREAVRARMRILIRHLLRKYKYPPEGYEDAIALVRKQAEELADARKPPDSGCPPMDGA